jgi:hypothetical protein
MINVLHLAAIVALAAFIVCMLSRSKRPESSPWWYVPIILVLVFSAYSLVSNNDAATDLAARTLTVGR